jgi:hypothetical protein
VPLAPGALFPGQEARVRVVVGAGAEAAEAAVYAAGLHSRHADGSLRAVLVQFRVASLGAAAAVPARLELAAGARPAALTLAAPLAAAAPAVPGGAAPGVALPTDPAYLVAADLVGPTGTSAAARGSAGPTLATRRTSAPTPTGTGRPRGRAGRATTTTGR